MAGNRPQLGGTWGAGINRATWTGTPDPFYDSDEDSALAVAKAQKAYNPPSTRAKKYEWMDDAECRTMDPKVFRTDTTLAKEACDRCPVQPRCLAFMLDTPYDQQGYAAGYTAAQREELKEGYGELETRRELSGYRRRGLVR